MSKPKIELVVRWGRFGENCKVLPVTVSRHLMEEMRERVELSDEPFALMLASSPRENAVEMRQRVFKLRETAHQIARMVERMLIEEFGAEDEICGYTKQQYSRFHSPEKV